MIHIDVPDFGKLEFKHLVSDFTGTLSEDGRLCPGIKERLNRIAEQLEIHVLTADTFGRAKAELKGVDCSIEIFEEAGLDRAKAAYLQRIGCEHSFAMGNGRNDRKMLKEARVGVAVCLIEGCAREAMESADLLVTSTRDALDLLLHPKRLIATLRN